MDNKNVPKRSKLFSCKYCNYNTSRKSQYDRHLTTPKHLRITNDNEMDNKNVPTHFECECGNTYSYISGLSKHKKKCEYITENIKNNRNSFMSEASSYLLKLDRENKNFEIVFNKFKEKFSWFQNTYSGPTVITEQWLKKYLTQFLMK